MKKPTIAQFLLSTLLSIAAVDAAEHTVKSPDGRIACTVTDLNGLHYRMEVAGKPLLLDSILGLEFKDGTKLGPAAVIAEAKTNEHTGHWENHFGQRRIVPDNWKELQLTLREGAEGKNFQLIVRAYNEGVAFRYHLPEASGLGDFVLTNELTVFRFPEDYRCWYGEPSDYAENHYPEGKLSTVPASKCVMPLLVETPVGYVAVAESDLRDWAGMFIAGCGTPTQRVSLAGRSDGNGLVASRAPRLSPWRVLMIGRSAAELAGSDIIATLATSNLIGDTTWVKPGVASWDPWWTGVNPNLPQFKGGNCRGDTKADMEFIDLAASMGWDYQLIDWFWYEGMASWEISLHSTPKAKPGDFTRHVPFIDIPKLVSHAKSKNVRSLIWAHSLDMQTFGVEKSMAYFAGLGFAGVKVDFLNSNSQETRQWMEKVLTIAAKHRLLINFHGAPVPTGLARTYPNFITQEGVLGNEYFKMPGNKCTPRHTATLPFTRALLGAMDLTPGAFLNRSSKDFRVTAPSQVIGTRAHELAKTVAYPSPLLVLCDSPKNYLGQPGAEFLRNLPTVWDESVVVQGEIGKSFVVARRSGTRWYLVAINGEDAETLQASLHFLGSGKWNLESFSDISAGSDYQAIALGTGTVDSATNLTLQLLPAGGYAAILTKK